MTGLSDSGPKFAPTSLERFALESSLDDFLLLYGDTAFLLITLAPTDTELLEGLKACDRMGRAGSSATSSKPPTQTAVSDLLSPRASSPSGSSVTIDEGGLGALLRLSAHYAITLRKRTADTHDVRITVGRSRSCDIALLDHRVSKSHAWFERNADGIFCVADSASSNGTFLDGQVLQSGVLTPVPEGRSLQFGDVHTFVVYPATLWNAMQRRMTSLMPRRA